MKYTKQYKTCFYIITCLLVFCIIAIFPKGNLKFKLAQFILLTLSLVIYLEAIWHLKKHLIISILSIFFILVYICLPINNVNKTELQNEYKKKLTQYEDTPYIWGGENSLGIDCSGLVRKGMINANLKLGLTHFSPIHLSHSFKLWYYDCSAKALKEEYKGFTKKQFSTKSINKTDHRKLEIGDIAVTFDGTHTFAYIGDNQWIEADPDLLKVIIEKTPSTNKWFKVPITILKWDQLIKQM